MIDVGRERPRRVVCLVVSIIVVAGLAGRVVAEPLSWMAHGGLLAMAQVAGQIAPGQAAERNSPDDNVFPRPERELLRQLSHARELTEQSRYSEAVRCLDSLLNTPEDYLFQPDDQKPLHRSLRLEANRILGRMPRPGREAYELQYGSRARHMLEQAVAHRDIDGLAAVSRRFFHTAAGYEATFLLGLHYLDRREPLAAALKLEPLREEAYSSDRFEPVLSLSLATCWHRAGYPERGDEVLQRLSERDPKAMLSIAGQDKRWLTDLTRLRGVLLTPDSPVEIDRSPSEWTQARGNASRSAVVSGSRPLLEPVWKVSLSDHPIAESLLATQSEYHALRKMPLISALQPLVLDDVVVMRTLHTLMAIDPTTGKRLWEVPADDALEEASEAYRAIFQQPGHFVGYLCQRAWKDHVYGSLSSDGRRVFAVEDLSLSVSGYGRRAVVRGGRRIVNPLWPKSYNRLAAYDARGGKLLWHLGGSSEEFDLELSGAFFLGSPLSIGRQLYQMVEISGEIRLVSLEAETGKLRWSQRIAMTDQGVLQSSVRRWTSLSPSCGSGLLVCPTVAGAIVAVDPGAPSLLWGYRYSRSPSAAQSRPSFTPFPSRQDTATEWIDAHLVVSKDRVLATPPDSDEIHCLSLLDGSLHWKRPRDGDLYLAAVQGDNVVLVGPKQVRALSLKTGRPAWSGRVLRLPEGSVPSGLGVHVAADYHLPLNSAEVFVFELETGREVQRVASSSGTIPGNLIAYRDKVISQSIQGVASFHQIESLERQVAQRLAADENDADAWRLKGRLLLDDGRPDEAVECLRRSYRLGGESISRSQLRELLLDGLGRDFSRYRESVDEIRELLDTRALEVAFIALMAAGLESESEWEPALERYLRLVDLCNVGCEMIDVDPSNSVRQDRWVRARLAGLREAAPSEIVAKLDAEVERRLEAAMPEQGTGTLAKFVECFGDQPAAEKASRELVDRYAASTDILAADVALRRGAKSLNAGATAAATRALAVLYERGGLQEESAAYYRELEEHWGDVVLDDGRTGRDVVESLPKKSAVTPFLHPDRDWPVGAVETAMHQSEPRAQSYRNHLPLEFQGRRGPFFKQGRGTIDQNEKELCWFDGFGREKWRLAIPDRDGQQIAVRRGVGTLSASGPLLILSLGYRWIAVDTLSEGGPKVVWDRTMIPATGRGPVDETPAVQLFNAQRDPRVFLSNMPHAGQGARFDASDAFNEDYLICRQFRECMALDSLTGETLWVRRDLPSDCAIFGDRERVVFVESERDVATIVDARDGRVLAENQPVPSRGEWIAVVEGNILRWRADASGRWIEMFDPWSQNTIWSKGPFVSNSKWYVSGTEHIGVMERGGRFALMSLRDGHARVDTRLESDPNLAEIILFQIGGSHILVTNGPPLSSKQPNLVFGRQILGTTSKTIQRGRVHAFGRSGERLWPDKPQGVLVENQQLLSEQAGWLPILTFAGQRYDQDNREMRWVTSVLMIDARNGRKLIDEEYRAKVPQFRIEGNPKNNLVECAMFDQSLRLTFTAKPPVDDESPEARPKNGTKHDEARPGESGSKNKTWNAILDAMRKAAGG